MAKKAGLPIKKAEGAGKVDKAIPVRIVDDMSPKVSTASNASYEAEEMKRKARYALEDIERAEVHKSDKNLMGHVKKLAKEKVNSLKKIC